MTETNPRLGRGLSALLGGGVDRAGLPSAEPAVDPSSAAASPAGLMLVPIDRIVPNPGQPRRTFDEGALDALASSIRETGLLQPVVVRTTPEGLFELIAGERRWQASRRAGVAELPVVVREADAGNRLEMALVENVVREDLNPVELARAVAALVEDFGRTHESVASTLGRSRPAISNLLRLLELPEAVTEMVATGQITEGHARAVLMADGARARRQLAERIVADGLSVRQAEDLARRSRPSSSGSRAEREPSQVADDAIDVLYGVFEVPVKVRSTAKGPVVELRFPDDDALRRAVERMRAERFT